MRTKLSLLVLMLMLVISLSFAACGGGAEIKVTIAETSNGTVTASNLTPNAGDDVTITAIPDTGYIVGGFKVNNANIAYTANEDNTATYVILDIQESAVVEVAFISEDATKPEPTAADIGFTIPTDHVYTGEPLGFSITDAKFGAITVKYDGETAAPVNAGTYVVTVDVAGGTHFAAATGIFLGNYTIAQATGAEVAAVPEADAVSAKSIEVKPIDTLSNGQSVEYALGTSNIAPDTPWQDSQLFTGLSGNTEYYLFVRAKESSNYLAGTPKVSAGITTLEAPELSGPSFAMKTVGYDAFSTEAFEIVGYGTIAVTQGTENYDGKIVWNDATKKIDVAAGLEVGEYNITLTASNGTAIDDSVFTFTFGVTELANGQLSSFDNEAYQYLASSPNPSWISGSTKLYFPAVSQMVDDSAHTADKTSVLKVTKDHKSNNNGFVKLEFANQGVARDIVSSVTLTLRIDNNMQSSGINIQIRLGEINNEQFQVAPGSYQTITISSSAVLDDMAVDGYMHSMGIHFSSQSADVNGSIYIADISFITKNTFMDENLSANTLAKFDSEGYLLNVRQSNWLNFRVATPTLVDDANAVGGKALKVAATGTRGHVLLDFARDDIRLENVQSVTVRLRFENLIAANNFDVRPASGNNNFTYTLSGTGYQTVYVQDTTALNLMADSNGVMRTIGLDFNGVSGAAIYIDTITFTSWTGTTGNLLSYDSNGDLTENAGRSPGSWQPGFTVGTPTMVEDEKAINAKVLRIPTGETSNRGFARIEFAEQNVLRKDVAAVQIRVRTEGVQLNNNTFVIRPGDNPQTIFRPFEEDRYFIVTVTNTESLNAMMNAEGYMSFVDIDFNCSGTDNGQGAIYIDYIRFISRDGYTDDSLDSGCLADFDNDEYLKNVSGLGLWNGNRFPTVNEIVDDVNATDGKALKATAMYARGFVQIYFANQNILRSDVASVQIRLRVDGLQNLATNNFIVRSGELNTQSFGTDHGLTNGGEYVTITVDNEDALNAMAAGDYMSSIGLDFNGTGSGLATIYVDSISFVLVDSTVVES